MTNRKLVITDPAKADLKDIRHYTVKNHGIKTADSYNALIKQAFKDLTNDPLRLGSKDRPEIADGIRTFHISLSRVRADSPIKAPRHFVLYFQPTENELVISRILHDTRDLNRHMPDEHRKAMALAKDDQRESQSVSKRKPERGRSR